MRRSYWIYSIGLAAVWAILLVVRFLIGGRHADDIVLYVFAGFVIGWVAETIARYVYPPPRHWKGTANPASEPRPRSIRLNYWTHSIGLGVVWSILLLVSAATGARVAPIWGLFAGFAISWVSGTIARYVYPPPSKWTTAAMP